MGTFLYQFWEDNKAVISSLATALLASIVRAWEKNKTDNK